MHKFLVALAAVTVKAAVHIVCVGENGAQRFSPDTITASTDDLVQFKFYKGSVAHSVVTSTFERPCSPSNNFFSSGPQRGDTFGDTTFTIKINNTDPIWYYSSLNNDCSEGMVGVINPPKDKTVHDYVVQAQGIVGITPSTVIGGELEGGAVTTQAVPAATESEPGFSVETTMPTTETSSTTRAISSTVTTSAAPESTSEGTGSIKSPQVIQELGLIIGGLIAMIM